MTAKILSNFTAILCPTFLFFSQSFCGKREGKLEEKIKQTISHKKQILIFPLLPLSILPFFI